MRWHIWVIETLRHLRVRTNLDLETQEKESNRHLGKISTEKATYRN